MLIGVGVVICATVALSLWPGASVEDRVRRTMLKAGQTELNRESPQSVEPKPGNLVIPERKPGETSQPIIRPFAGETVPVPPAPKVTAGGGTGTTELPKSKPSETIHVVAQDETLSRISQRYYGTSAQWQKILQANSAILKDPAKIKPGMRLVIPNPTTGAETTNKNTTTTNR